MISLYDGCKGFEPRRIIRPRSVDDVRAAIRRAADEGMPVRPMGLGYSWSEHTFTNGVSLRTDAIRGGGAIVDRTRKTITVDASMRMGDVTRALVPHGLCLPSLAFLPEMTAGGAVATATHGTNHKAGTMSDFVVAMDVVLPSSELKHFSADTVPDEDMRAARVAVGMLGVITRVEFQAIDMPWVRYETLNYDLEGFMAERQSILQRYDHVWVHWTLGTNEIRVEGLETRAREAPGFHRYARHRNAVWQPTTSSTLKTVLKPLAHFAQDLVRPLVPVTRAKSPTEARLSMQYAIASADWPTVVAALATSDFAMKNAGKIMEMKFVRGNDLSFLGPNAGQDAVCFNVYWMVGRAELPAILRPFEDMMKSFDARPHWGKDHAVPDVAYMRRAYPGWDAFDDVRKRYDKDDLFIAIR